MGRKIIYSLLTFYLIFGIIYITRQVRSEPSLAERITKNLQVLIDKRKRKEPKENK